MCHYSVNKISSLADFEDCQKLQELYLRKNNIKDINDLVYLQVKKLNILISQFDIRTFVLKILNINKFMLVDWGSFSRIATHIHTVWMTTETRGLTARPPKITIQTNLPEIEAQSVQKKTLKMKWSIDLKQLNLLDWTLTSKLAYLNKHAHKFHNSIHNIRELYCVQCHRQHRRCCDHSIQMIEAVQL